MSLNLLETFQLGGLTLSNRMVMAPMTRNRATERGLATPMMATYYRQRASAGLLVSESSPISLGGVGYPSTPGIHSEAHAQSWRAVTDAVHKAGSARIFLQLQHCGRISHPSLLPNQAQPVAPSALRPAGQAVTYAGMQDFETPRALEAGELPAVAEEFRRAALLAERAGFDGVEVHAANGYLLDQFLRDGTNHRTDAYGGTERGRMRLLDEVLGAVCSVWPAKRVGVRFSPENTFNSMTDSDPQAHFEYFMERLNAKGVAYVHVLEGDMMGRARALDYRRLRARFSGAYIASNGYDFKSAEIAVGTGAADLVAFGTAFLANPDLVRRYQRNLPLNAADRSTFYGGGEAGYIDYPLHP